MINSVSTNLMVANVAASLRFYHEFIGAAIAFSVDAEQNTTMPGEISEDVVFASIRAGESELMLQERQSLIADVPGFSSDAVPGGSIALYFRVDDVEALAAKIPDGVETIKALETTWYGMREFTLRDPDGYLLTIGMPSGEAPPVNP